MKDYFWGVWCALWFWVVPLDENLRLEARLHTVSVAKKEYQDLYLRERTERTKLEDKVEEHRIEATRLRALCSAAGKRLIEEQYPEVSTYEYRIGNDPQIRTGVLEANG